MEILQLPKVNEYSWIYQGVKYASSKNFGLLREALKPAVISLLNILFLCLYFSVYF